MLLVDTKKKTMIQDVELKKNIAASRPHTLWLKEQVLTYAELFYSGNIVHFCIMCKYLLAEVHSDDVSLSIAVFNTSFCILILA
jgi:hypothetical protein